MKQSFLQNNSSGRVKVPDSSSIPHKQSIGMYGESLACEYLMHKGYGVVQRNFKARYGEIDIIAQKQGILIFVEVKTRMGRKFGTPEEAVTPRKIHEVVMTAQYYLMLNTKSTSSYRIDVVAIELFPDKTIRDLRHIENITM